MARPTATCALPPPGGTANTRSRRAPSVSSYWRAAHSHDSMSTLWLTTTAHSSAVQNRGSGAAGRQLEAGPGWAVRARPTRPRRARTATPIGTATAWGRCHSRNLPDQTRSPATFRRLQWRPWAGPARRRSSVWSIVAAGSFASACSCSSTASPSPVARRRWRRSNAEVRAHGEAGAVDAGRGRGGRVAVRRPRRARAGSPMRTRCWRRRTGARSRWRRSTKACRASPMLAGARSVTLNRLRQQSAGGAATVEASGVLDSRAGAVPIGFVFLQESGRLRILVVSLAGGPGPSGRARPRCTRASRRTFLVQQSAPHARRRLPVRFVVACASPLFPCALAAFNLTCARPIAAGPPAPGAPAAAAPGAAARRRHGGAAAGAPETDPDDRAHRAARAGQDDRAPRGARLRDADRVDRRGRALRGRAPRVGRRGAHPGRRRTRAGRGRPGSRACRSAAPTATARPRKAVLVVRRPLPARGEHQIAHVYLPAVCNGAPEHFRFALPDAEPQATDPRALAYWADAFRPPRRGQRLGRVRGRARARALSRARGEGGRRRRPIRATRRRQEARGARRRRRASRSRRRRRPRPCRAQRRAARRA